MCEKAPSVVWLLTIEIPRQVSNNGNKTDVRCHNNLCYHVLGVLPKPLKKKGGTAAYGLTDGLKDDDSVPCT